METHGWLMAILATRQGDVDIAFNWIRRNWGMATLVAALISGGSVTYTKVYQTADEVVALRADVRLILRKLDMKPREARRTTGEPYLDLSVGSEWIGVEP